MDGQFLGLEDEFLLLGLKDIQDQEITQAILDRAYRRAAIKYHPDKNPTSEAHDRFVELSQAYGKLSRRLSGEVDFDDELLANGTWSDWSALFDRLFSSRLRDILADHKRTRQENPWTDSESEAEEKVKVKKGLKKSKRKGKSFATGNSSSRSSSKSALSDLPEGMNGSSSSSKKLTMFEEAQVGVIEDYKRDGRKLDEFDKNELKLYCIKHRLETGGTLKELKHRVNEHSQTG